MNYQVFWIVSIDMQSCLGWTKTIDGWWEGKYGIEFSDLNKAYRFQEQSEPKNTYWKDGRHFIIKELQ